MTRKQIDAARERRLWLTQVALPLATLTATAMSIPEVRTNVAEKYNKGKDWLQKKFKKK